jgi:regulator of RNase E activity RraA
MPKLLSDEQICEYQQDGLVFPIPVLSAAEVATARAALEELAAALGGHAEIARLRHLQLFHRWVQDLVLHPRVLDAVEDESGAIVLSYRKAKRQKEWEDVIAKHKEGDVVAGAVTRKIKGGLLVNIGVNVFLPASQVDIRRPPDIADYIGKTIECKILKIDEARRNIVVSRRKLIDRVMLRRMRPGSVLVANAERYQYAGAWGEVLSVAAQARGIAGLVIDGAVRDIEAITQRRFPVFSRGLAIGACKKEKIGTLNEPIDLGGVTVRSGDIVVGAGDGVVILDSQTIEQVLQAGIARRERESEIFHQLNQGKTTIEILNLPRWDRHGRKPGQ